jgi:hypothetical protein
VSAARVTATFSPPVAEGEASAAHPPSIDAERPSKNNRFVVVIVEILERERGKAPGRNDGAGWLRRRVMSGRRDFDPQIDA